MSSIESILNNIFLSRTGIDFGQNEELKDKALLGNNCKIAPRELILVCVDIEREFNVTVPENQIINGGFKTYNRIRDMIVQLKSKAEYSDKS